MTTIDSELRVDPALVLEALRRRYATKRFDPERRIPAELWSTLEASLVLSPSSFGLQPWRFVVVEDADLRRRLREHSWNQPQTVEASHFVVLARRSPFDVETIARHLRRTGELRGVPAERLEASRTMIEGFVLASGFDADAWTARQVYIALGFFLETAALLGIDACPMEGIDPDAFDRLLDLPATGYRTTVAVAAGYRRPDDPDARLPKVRHPAQELIVRR